jgi:mRNA interferase MazF
VGVVVRRFDVFLVQLDPTIGSKIQKTRPGLIISPDEMNRCLRTVILAPMTTTSRSYPSRVACVFRGKAGQIVLDQLRTVDKARLVKRLGVLDESVQQEVLSTLAELFAP